jgi:hypothetical protein
VSFEHPAALWGLSSLLLLILFSLWRQASARVTVSSLRLWKEIPERNPPVRALRRPRWRLELLLQALAIAAAVGALAKPYRETSVPRPRRVALVFDTSARMRAGGRLAKMQARARELIRDQLSHDEVTLYAAGPGPRTIPSPAEAAVVDAHVDLEPLLQAAKASSEHVILFSDAAAGATPAALFGAPADNVGIVEFSVSDEEAFVRIVNHGPPRPIPIELSAGALKVREILPAGQRTWSHRADYSKAPSVRIALEAKDSFPLDDAVEATRLAPGETAVTLTGRPHESLGRVFRAVPGVTVRRGGAGASVSVGYDDEPGPAEVRVHLRSVTGAPLGGEAAVGDHPLTRELQSRGKELGSVGWGELPPEERRGQPLWTVDGKVVAAVRGKEIHLCVDLNRWQAGPPSFPIFWMNVVEFARQAAPGWTVVRAGRPVPLAPPTAVASAPPGAMWTLTPDGTFVAYTAGTYRLQGTEQDVSLTVNLLDERESDTAGKSQELAWDPGSPAGRALQRQDLGGISAWMALAFLVLAWLLQLRPE